MSDHCLHCQDYVKNMNLLLFATDAFPVEGETSFQIIILLPRFALLLQKLLLAAYICGKVSKIFEFSLDEALL